MKTIYINIFFKLVNISMVIIFSQILTLFTSFKITILCKQIFCFQNKINIVSTTPDDWKSCFLKLKLVNFEKLNSDRFCLLCNYLKYN